MLKKVTTIVAAVGILTLLTAPLILAQQVPTTPADLPTPPPTIPPNCGSPPLAPTGSASPDYIACTPAPASTGGSLGQGDSGFQQYAPNDYCLRLVDYCVERKLEH